tara:strand:- start:3439 stop:3837 length:399 start_codon:yes stop_codon:yes gene_type:complete
MKQDFEEIYEQLCDSIEKNNKEVLSLLKIIHFYETLFFEIKLLTDEQMLLTESHMKKAIFVRNMVDLAENRAEKVIDSQLYDLYQDQKLLPKKSPSRPKKRTKMQRAIIDVYGVYDSLVCGDEVGPKDTKLN